jgi:hypothetical protein
MHFNSDVFCLQLSCCIYALNFCIHSLMPHWLGLCVLRMTYRQNRLHETFFHTVIILSKHHHHHTVGSSVTGRCHKNNGFGYYHDTILYHMTAKMNHIECLLLTKSITLILVRRHRCRDRATCRTPSLEI